MTGSSDFKVHEETYRSFIGWLKAGTVIVALVAALVIFLISR